MPDIEITSEILQCLRSRILHEDDRAMFDDLAKVIGAGAHRSAYIMLWISCAESLKRRLKWAAEKDNQAGKLLGEVEDAEQKHHAVDAKLITACKKIGVISDVEATHLSQIYENRNIYGHPYNLAPSKATVLSSLNVIIDSVFSKPNRLKHSYALDRLKYLNNDETYLEDDVAKIEEYAKQVADRMDQSVYRYFILRYIDEIHKIWGDPERSIFKRRGMYFVKAFLEYVGVDSILAGDEWHDLMAKMPNFISWLAGWKFIFQSLSEVAKDEAVLKNIEMAEGNPRRLNRLYSLSVEGCLSVSQQYRFDEKCKSLTPSELGKTEIPLAYVIEEVLKRLNSPWYDTANSGATILFWTKVRELSALSKENQCKVGVRLATASLMNAYDAVYAVHRIAKLEVVVPYDVKLGYCKHFFSEQIRKSFQRKSLYSDSVAIMSTLETEDADAIDNDFRNCLRNDDGLVEAVNSEEGKAFMIVYEASRFLPF